MDGGRAGPLPIPSSSNAVRERPMVKIKLVNGSVRSFRCPANTSMRVRVGHWIIAAFSFLL